MAKKRVVYDAGHGRYTAGKRSPAGEREWAFNDAVVRAAIERTKQYGNVEVMRTDDPTGNTDVSLSARCIKANNWGADVFASCHHNAMGGQWFAWEGGVETYTFNGAGANPKSVQLANQVNPRVAKAMGLRDRGIKKENFAVLRETKMPAILVEGGFMDSNVDIKALRDSGKLKAQGYAIADGIAAYLGLKLISGASTPPVTVPSKPSAGSGTATAVYANKYGDTGARVLQQQKDFNKIGIPVAEDSSFGPALLAATKLFQKKYGLAVDGSYGPASQKKMAELLRSVAANPKPKAYDLRYGDSGAKVLAYQKNLNFIGIKVDEDGSFGKAMTEATKLFQKRYGLTADGLYGPAAQAKMAEIVAKVKADKDKQKDKAEDGGEINRVIVDGVQIGAYSKKENALAVVEKNLGKAKKIILEQA